jgi:hypothetical protein
MTGCALILTGEFASAIPARGSSSFSVSSRKSPVKKLEAIAKRPVFDPLGTHSTSYV